MFKRHLALALIFGMAATAPPALAQSMRCAPRDTLTERLERVYSEQQTAVGLQSSAKLIEVWSSPETGTWTILMTMPDGTSCVLASGDNWLNGPAPDAAALGIPS